MTNHACRWYVEPHIPLLILWKPAVSINVLSYHHFLSIKFKWNMKSLLNSALCEFTYFPYNLEWFRNIRTFCITAWKSSCVQVAWTWLTALRNSVQRTPRTWRTFPVMLSECYLRTPHPLAITLEMPGSDHDSSDSEHEEGWTGPLISFLTIRLSQRFRADLIAFEVKAREPVTEWGDTRDLELQHSWRWKPEFGWRV